MSRGQRDMLDHRNRFPLSSFLQSLEQDRQTGEGSGGGSGPAGRHPAGTTGACWSRTDPVLLVMSVLSATCKSSSVVGDASEGGGEGETLENRETGKIAKLFEQLVHLRSISRTFEVT